MAISTGSKIKVVTGNLDYKLQDGMSGVVEEVTATGPEFFSIIVLVLNFGEGLRFTFWASGSELESDNPRLYGTDSIRSVTITLNP
ncbi:hypothetical protein [Myxococcus phage Mx1]|nr:hypothetical protein [Myxococcus phage Mx1]